MLAVYFCMFVAVASAQGHFPQETCEVPLQPDIDWNLVGINKSKCMHALQAYINNYGMGFFR